MMVNTIITFVASFWIWVIFGTLFVLWIIDGKIKKEQVLHAIVSVVIAWVFSEIIKTILPTPRPYVFDHMPVLTVTKPGDAAFPSSHTAVSFAVAVTIWLHDKKWGIFFLVSALAIGIARILGNVHYPIDVIGGAIIGSLVAFSVEKLHLFTLLSRLTGIKK